MIIEQLFGFHQKVLQLHPTKIYRSDQTANILKNKEERYSRVPRLSDTRYSAK